MQIGQIACAHDLLLYSTYDTLRARARLECSHIAFSSYDQAFSDENCNVSENLHTVTHSRLLLGE